MGLSPRASIATCSPNWQSPQEIRQKIDGAFQQLFHGDATNQTVYYPAGSNSNGPLAHLTDIKHNDVRSEGLSYGMIIAVQLDKKAEFDAIWNWSKTYFVCHGNQSPVLGFFSVAGADQRCPHESVLWRRMAKIIMSLRCISPRIAGAMVRHLRLPVHRRMNCFPAWCIGPKSPARSPWRGTNAMTVTAGPLFHAEHKMVLFSPSSERVQFSDPSYHLPAFYELWSRWAQRRTRGVWKQAAQVSRDYFVKSTHPVTALNPCYANFDGSLVARPSHYATNFSYDAFRTAGNWAVDWSWWGKDPRQRELSDKLQVFFESQGTNYGCVFTLDGK